MKGLSDANLLRLRREVCHLLFRGRCFICGERGGEMEDHHYVKRKNFLLRYSYRNSFLVHKWKQGNKKMSCHAFCETPAGKHKINKYLFENGWFEYIQERTGSCKQWFVDRGITKKEYLVQMKNDLLEMKEKLEASE